MAGRKTYNHDKKIASSDIEEHALKRLTDIKFALDQSTIVNVTDCEGTILSVNDKLCEISGYSREELIGQNHRILNSGYHPKSFFTHLWQTVKQGKIWQGEIRNITKDGEYFWVDTTIVPFTDHEGEPYQFISVRHDITELKKMEQEILQREQMYRLITENTSDLIAIINEEGKFFYVSPSHETLLNEKLSIIDQSYLTDWIHEGDRDRVLQNIQSLIKNQKTTKNLEFRLRVIGGTYVYANSTVNAIYKSCGKLNCLTLITRDITESKRVEETFKHLSSHDALTNLPNRRLFLKQLHEIIDQPNEATSSFALLFIDLDQFKYVNDRWGHDVGDMLLIEFSDRLRLSLRPNDIVARLGGDEFAILLKDVTNETSVRHILRELYDLVKEPIDLEGKQYTMSCSMGISFYPEDATTVDDLLSKSDTALYAMKGRGNGYLFYDPEMEEQSLEQILLENELRKAMKREEFYIDYQPKFNLFTGQLTGMEALLRWKHPELGIISPDRFIPLAESTELIIPIGEWVLEEALKQNKQWQTLGYDSIQMAVNLSVVQLVDENFVPRLEKILNTMDYDPALLELEVTESIFAEQADVFQAIQKIRELGVQVSVDDFGTGYSSFSYLKNLPIDKLKIDRAFVRDIDNNLESQAIVTAILLIADELAIDVIAEGIERFSQARMLKHIGCKYGQGYYYSRPASPEMVEHFLTCQLNYKSK